MKYIYLALLLCFIISCNSTSNYQRAEVYSVLWEVDFFIAQTPKIIIDGFENSNDNIVIKKNIYDQGLLQAYQNVTSDRFDDCDKVCPDAVRVVVLLYSPTNEQNPDTLTFGHVRKMSFNQKYYAFDEELLKSTLNKVDSSHLQSYVNLSRGSD